MKWIKISIETTTNAVDLISNLLDECGLEGIQIEDNVPLSEEEKQAMFIDILPELPPDDGRAFVSSYVGLETNLEELIRKIEEGLEELSDFIEIGKGKVEITETDDKDWIDNWKAFFKPFRIAEDIVIKPTWEELEDKKPEDIMIEIDPGTAFGTGTHETTQLCILGLRKYLTKETRLLDIGCGSGILSIIGVKLGAKSAVGTDIDPTALVVARENIKVNGLSEKEISVYDGNIIEDSILKEKIGLEKYDMVTANILADVIIPLSGEIKKHMKPGAFFISSGIINTMRDEVKSAILKNGFEIIEENQKNDWVSFVAKNV